MGSQDADNTRAVSSVTLLFFGELLKLVSSLALSDSHQIQAFEVFLLLCKTAQVLCTQVQLPTYTELANEIGDFVSTQLRSNYDNIIVSMKGELPNAAPTIEYPFLTDANFAASYGHPSFRQLATNAADFKHDLKAGTFAKDEDSFFFYCFGTD